MATPVITNSLKATGKSMLGLPGIMLAGGAIVDYNSRRNEGQSSAGAILGTAITNVLPNLLLTGPRGMIYQTLIAGLPLVPAVAQALSVTSNNRENYIRHSAMPFSHYGYAPTMGAIQSLQRAMDGSNGMRGLAQTHAGLAAQAMRR